MSLIGPSVFTKKKKTLLLDENVLNWKNLRGKYFFISPEKDYFWCKITLGWTWYRWKKRCMSNQFSILIRILIFLVLDEVRGIYKEFEASLFILFVYCIIDKLAFPWASAGACVGKTAGWGEHRRHLLCPIIRHDFVAEIKINAL